jgi:tripartite-type tricarboxylate transporter receptor subunit TctC
VTHPHPIATSIERLVMSDHATRFPGFWIVTPLPLRAVLLAAACVLCAVSPDLSAQAYPARVVHLVVPTAPAGITDGIARLVAEKLTESMHQSVVVENRPGANGNIAAQAVARAPADGYTLLVGTIGVMSINPYVYKEAGYDPQKDFVAVAQLVSFSNVLAVHPSVPANSIAELIAYAKAHPGKLSYSSSGSGGSPHMSSALFLSMAGIDAVHIPYKGSAPALTDLVSGQVQFTFGDPLATLPHVRAGKLRALGVSGARRLAIAPDIPTVAESGLPGYVVNGWLGVVAPAGTPRDIVERLNAQINRALADPAVQEKLRTLAAEPGTGTAADFQRYIAAENQQWSRLVREAKITAD